MDTSLYLIDSAPAHQLGTMRMLKNLQLFYLFFVRSSIVTDAPTDDGAAPTRQCSVMNWRSFKTELYEFSLYKHWLLCTGVEEKVRRAGRSDKQLLPKQASGTQLCHPRSLQHGCCAACQPEVSNNMKSLMPFQAPIPTEAKPLPWTSS